MKTISFTDEENPFPPLTILTLLVLLVLILSLIGAGIIYGFNQAMGSSFESILEGLNAESTSQERNRVRISVVINHLCTFILPPFLLGLLLFRSRWMRFLSLQNRPKILNIFLASLFILAALPFAQFTFWLNKKIPLPAWASSMENATTDMVNNLLISDYPYELWFNLVVVALIPAIGEEWVFRGVLQKNLQRVFKQPHLAVWLSALIFSAIHFQFEGFIPRMVLGALLGYLFVWTNNLWIPMIAHFVNNAVQVLAQYLYQQDLSHFNPEQIEGANWGLSIFSFIFAAAIGYFIYQNNHYPTAANIT